MNWEQHINRSYSRKSDNFRAGYRARLYSGQRDRMDNPNDIFSQEHDDWEDGWYRADGDIVQNNMGVLS